MKDKAYVITRKNRSSSKPWRAYTTPEWREAMEKIDGCMDCGHCREHCPYGLDTPELLRANLREYREFWETHKSEY